MKLLPWILLVAALLFGSLYIEFVHDPFVRRVAALEKQGTALDSAVTVLRQDSADHAQLDKVREDSIGVLLVRAKAPRHTDTIERHADTLAEQAKEAVKDSTARVLVEAALSAKDSVIARIKHDCNRMKSDLLGVITLQRQQVATRDADLSNLRKALATALVQRDRWRQQAKPGLPLRLVRSLPVLAIGTLVGLVL